MSNPDIFTQVHKGIRNALFAATVALGRTEPEDPSAQRLLSEALRFMAHHGENEDRFLVPLLRQRAPEIAERITRAHRDIESRIAAIEAALSAEPPAALYQELCRLVGRYVEHMNDEEQLEPEIRAALEVSEIADFGRRAIERTAPADQTMMLRWMLSAMLPRDAEALVAHLPPDVAERLRRADDDAKHREK